ncbi:MAG: glycosyl hydrolase family protein [Pedosphaera sp.]|nr:glycosyl hydrolase family protein [Pedosphaera sp.]
MALTRSSLSQLTDPTAFLWSAGIEDTFITDPWPETGRILDEYELTGHYHYWKQDINLLKELGVKVVRYGTPWYRISPAQGKWDWSWTDRSLEYLLESGIDPVVDLVHYGVPAWIEGAFLNPDFPQHMAEYASRLAERFKGRIHAYTPLNEPRITAWYCGKLGWWPPYKRGWKGFVQLMLGICRGIVLTVEALQAVDSEIVPVHVDATDLYETAEPALEDEVRRRQEIVFLALDLISGRIVPGHPLYEWLLKQGVRDESLVWFKEHAIDLPLIGINLYPMYSRKILYSSPQGVRIRMPYSSGEIVERLGELYWQRYQSPLFISETASMGSIKRRRAWLDSSVESVKRTRSRGIPMVGYTWWPMLGIVTWAYRQGSHPAAYYIKQMGLWDLDPDPAANLRRIHTPLVDTYRELVAGGCEMVGNLELEKEGV